MNPSKSSSSSSWSSLSSSSSSSASSSSPKRPRVLSLPLFSFSSFLYTTLDVRNVNLVILVCIEVLRAHTYAAFAAISTPSSIRITPFSLAEQTPSLLSHSSLVSFLGSLKCHEHPWVHAVLLAILLGDGLVDVCMCLRVKTGLNDHAHSAIKFSCHGQLVESLTVTPLASSSVRAVPVGGVVSYWT